MIPDDFIDELLTRVDIVDVVGSRLRLKKMGQNYNGLCPFHDEKTPSFSVSQDKQLYHCFGCKAGGNVIKFVREIDGLDFPAAVESLSRSVGLEIPTEEKTDSQETKKRNAIYGALQVAGDFFRQNLRESRHKDRAVAYFKGRGIDGSIARDFGLGYAPPGWDNLVKYFSQKEINEKEVLDAGLIAPRENERGFYDRFRDRVIFPIRDPRGRIIAFGGRVLEDQTKPKYLNSPESQVFRKNLELYGIYEARKRSRKLEMLMVVEGYMDVVALAQNEINFSVATLGTAINSQQIKSIFRIVPKVVFCFDGDVAGRNAAWKGLVALLSVIEDGYSAKFLFLPDGEDPDSMVRKEGKEKFMSRIESSKTLAEFFLDSLQSMSPMDTEEGKATAVKKAAPLINLIREGVLKEILINALSSKIGIDAARLRNLAGIKDNLGVSEPNQIEEKTKLKFQTNRSKSTFLIEYALSLFAANPELGLMVDSEILDIFQEDIECKVLFEILSWAIETVEVDKDIFHQYCEKKPHLGYLKKMASREIILTSEELQEEFGDTLKKIASLKKNDRESQFISTLAKRPLGELTEEEKKVLSNFRKKRANRGAPPN